MKHILGIKLENPEKVLGNTLDQSIPDSWWFQSEFPFCRKPSLFASFFQVYSRWRVCCNTDGFGQAIAGPPAGGSACFKVLVTRFQAGVTLVGRLKQIVLVQAYLNNSKLPYNRTSTVLYPLHFFYFFDFLFHLPVELLPGATRCRETHPRCAGRARHRRI